MIPAARVQYAKLKAQREQRKADGASREDQSSELARARDAKVEAETDRITAELSAAMTKNLFSQTLGCLVKGVVDVVGDVVDAVEDVADDIGMGWAIGGAAVIGTLMGAHLVAAGTALAGALPTIAVEGARWGLTTMTVGKPIDATSNAVALDAGSDANDARKRIEVLDEQIGKLESGMRKQDDAKASKRKERGRAKQGLRRANEDRRRVEDAVNAGIRGRGGTVSAANASSAGVRSMQAARAGAAQAEASALMSDAKALESQMEQMQAEARALRSEAGDEKWANEKLRTWLDFSAAWVEVAATTISLGATGGITSATSSAQALKAGLDVASAGLNVAGAGMGLAASFVTDDDANAKLRQAERMQVEAGRLGADAELTRASATEAAFVAEQTMERASEMVEVSDDVRLGAGGNAKLLRAQMKRVANLGVELLESARERHGLSGDASAIQQEAIGHREDADDAAASKAVVGQAMAAGGVVFSAFGAGFKMAQLDVAMSGVDVDATQAAMDEIAGYGAIVGGIGGVGQGGGQIASAAMDDGSGDTQAAEHAQLDADRARRDVDDAAARIERARKQHRRSYDNAIDIARNTAPTRA